MSGALTIEKPSRGDFLYLSAVGVAAATWPLVDPMNPNAATLAMASTEVAWAPFPAPLNLAVPEYTFPSDAKVKIG